VLGQTVAHGLWPLVYPSGTNGPAGPCQPAQQSVRHGRSPWPLPTWWRGYRQCIGHTFSVWSSRRAGGKRRCSVGQGGEGRWLTVQWGDNEGGGGRWHDLSSDMAVLLRRSSSATGAEGGEAAAKWRERELVGGAHREGGALAATVAPIPLALTYLRRPASDEKQKGKEGGGARWCSWNVRKRKRWKGGAWVLGLVVLTGVVAKIEEGVWFATRHTAGGARGWGCSAWLVGNEQACWRGSLTYGPRYSLSRGGLNLFQIQNEFESDSNCFKPWPTQKWASAAQKNWNKIWLWSSWIGKQLCP
jgi:hypothetical protein